MEGQANTAKKEYPQNLLDAIADGEWEEPLPADFPQTLAYVLAGLTEREQAVIEMRFKRRYNYTQAGCKINVTRERIRQIEAKAIRKLRHPSRTKLLIRGVLGWVEDARETGRQETISKELRQAVDGVLEIADALKTNLNAAAKIETEKYKTANPADIPIDEVALSLRSFNILRRAGYKTLGEVSGLTWDKLLQLRNMGRKSAEEVLKKLEEHGLKLRGEVNGNENI